MPAIINSRSASGEEVAGPIVQTILVCLGRSFTGLLSMFFRWYFTQLLPCYCSLELIVKG
jgi:hypothetical protein